MDYVRISVRLIALVVCTVFFTQKAIAQQEAIGKIISGVFDINSDTVRSIKDENATYIVVTQKNCLKCFTAVCSYLKEAGRKTDAKIYVIIFMPKNYLEVIQMAQKYKDAIPCAMDFYFFFTSNMMDEGITRIAESPSPQLLINSRGEFSYLPYSETIKL